MIVEILLVVLILTVIGIGVLLYQRLTQVEQKTQTSPELMEWLKSTDARFNSGMTAFNSRLDNAANVISSLQKEVGVFTEIGRSMKDLQTLLQSPKLRGNVGEQILSDMLKQYFPPTAYSLQHGFANGEKVDALIRTANGDIPIDSKFPMENFRAQLAAESDVAKDTAKKQFVRDVKKHVTDIAKKYILPEQHTTDYALMYIPSEAIYYEIIKDADLYDFASSKRILPVSPMSFYAYIQAILMSYEGQRIQEQAKQIIQIIQGIKSDYEKVDESMGVLGKHITNAYNQIPNVARSINAIGQKVTATQLMSKTTTSLDELPLTSNTDDDEN